MEYGGTCGQRGYHELWLPSTACGNLADQTDHRELRHRRPARRALYSGMEGTASS